MIGYSHSTQWTGGVSLWISTDHLCLKGNRLDGGNPGDGVLFLPADYVTSGLRDCH